MKSQVEKTQVGVTLFWSNNQCMTSSLANTLAHFCLLLSVNLTDAAPGHFQMNHSKFPFVCDRYIWHVWFLVDAMMTTALLINPLHFAVRGNYEDGGTGLPRKHDFTRSESENWRTSRDDQNGEDDEGGWRLAGSRRDSDRWCPPSPGGHSTDHITNTFIFDELSWINVFVLYHHFCCVACFRIRYLCVRAYILFGVYVISLYCTGGGFREVLYLFVFLLVCGYHNIID